MQGIINILLAFSIIGLSVACVANAWYLYQLSKRIK